MQVAFCGRGSATSRRVTSIGSMPGPTPAPSCTPTVTQVGLNVQCLSDPDKQISFILPRVDEFLRLQRDRNIVGGVTAIGGRRLLDEAALA